MSNSPLIHWFRDLLFGQSPASPPPSELYELLLQLESHHLDWERIMETGGLIHFPYYVHGDLAVLIDNLEKQLLEEKEPPFEHFETPCVRRFWGQLKILLARVCAPPLENALVPTSDDDQLLKALLADPEKPHPDFWVNVARKLIRVRRPMNELHQAPSPPHPAENAAFLYSVTCESQGRYWDPFSLYLVPRSQYVDPVYWQTSQLLESFLQSKPTHPLAKSIQELLHQTVQQLLEGERPRALHGTYPALDAFLHNIDVVHQQTPELIHRQIPPKVVDTFQRLLSLCHQDHLWERTFLTEHTPKPAYGLDHLLLFERFLSLERENELLRKHLDKHLDSTFDSTFDS